MEDRIIDLIRKAEVLREKAQYREALKMFKGALSLSRKQGNVDGILDATLGTADISRMTGDFDSAIKNYEEALEASEAMGNRLTAADCMVGMGLSLRAIGMWKEALRFIKAAKKIYDRERDRKGTAFSLWAQAGALRVGAISGNLLRYSRMLNRHFLPSGSIPGLLMLCAGWVEHTVLPANSAIPCATTFGPTVCSLNLETSSGQHIHIAASGTLTG